MTIDGTPTQISVTIGGETERLIAGTAGNDVLTAPIRESFLGLGGRDRISGNGGSDTIDGGAGADSLYGGWATMSSSSTRWTGCKTVARGWIP